MATIIAQVRASDNVARSAVIAGCFDRPAACAYTASRGATIGDAMLIFPAIDLRRGRCVRLRQGDPAEETVFSDDPVAMARHWVQAGAAWLHIVNLDGAFGDQGSQSPNLQRLAEIRQAVAVPIQFGGGLRTRDDIEQVLALGATRVVLGTALIEQPQMLAEVLARLGPERIVAGLDARDGKLATHGWQSATALDAFQVGLALRQAGVVRAVYTDIGRDGMLAGVDVQGTASLAQRSGLQVIASGGVRDLDDIRRLVQLAAPGVEGVIVGQALYSGQFDLASALAATRAEEA